MLDCCLHLVKPFEFNCTIIRQTKDGIYYQHQYFMIQKQKTSVIQTSGFDKLIRKAKLKLLLNQNIAQEENLIASYDFVLISMRHH